MTGYAEALPAESVVIELLESIDGDPEVVNACQRLKQMGFTLALDDFVYRPSLEPLIALADIIKIDVQDSGAEKEVQHARQMGRLEPILLAEKVETHEEYTLATDLGFALFQGYFFCRPQIVEGRDISGVRLTHLGLLQAVTRPQMDINNEVEGIIRADVSVTHRLLKYLGSAAFGFRAEVRSIRHGLALLGKEQTRRFVTLVALHEMGTDKPHELLVSAAVRASFCELIGDNCVTADRKPELFLLGALSLADAMLDQPMSRILKELPVSDDLKRALQGDASPLRPVLEFVEQYERGDWTACADLGSTLGLLEREVLTSYSRSIWWATQALTR